MSSTSPDQTRSIVVLGAGVIGLTTALVLQETGDYKVTILASKLPTDPKSIHYTSHWAGAHHVISVSNEFQARLEKETFEVMWRMSAPDGGAEHCFLRAPQKEYYLVPQADPDILSVYPNFKKLPEDVFKTIPGVLSAVSLTALNINTPIYLPYLMSRFLAAGGQVVRANVQHIQQVVEGGVSVFSGGSVRPGSVDAIVNCTGLGARCLGGVEDSEMYPQRGQTVIIYAPWIKEGRSLVAKEGSRTYIIPRRGGNLVLGGTRVADDWYPVPRPETKVDILQRALDFYPEIAPPNIRAVRKPTIDDLIPLIVDEGCGLRPSRKGGIRLETEWMGVPVIHNYGHGGYGFQTSWGSATAALELVKEALKK
ncbi:nucleotide-binding domain-containing protein [Vararia minispora EC-137]|uniref:Nucleotide-binding domain-containing protein n=1 Tax=Vararia minispora EC-137 TaxID=1314806 RepID=A0ACB8QZ04_9AGAM|nr:nucleotide-binding domain-containing protein [Vararia minispora EC-137]